MPNRESPFRVIVVGGGVAGLAAAHVLAQAGIDYVVLERSSTVAPQLGSSIAIYPNGSRILKQLGLLEAVQRHTVPPDRWLARLPDGKKIVDSSFFRYLEQNHGFGMLLIERRQFLQELYDNLPDKTRVRINSPVYDIKQDEDGVEVTLDNGEVERGDIVLGCDGVYSSVRTLMWEHANKLSPGLITVQEKTAITAHWKCLVLMTEGVPELGTRNLTVVHNKNYSHMFTMTPTYGYFFVYFRLDEPCRWPKRMRFTDKDADDLAASIADHAMSDTVVFAEVWKHRLRANVVLLEEGILDHWHHGRIVLAGDACHKVMPNMALGGVSSIESVSVLTNHLRKLLVENNGKKPSASDLNQAFASYQAERFDRLKNALHFSSIVNHAQSWSTPWYKILSTWIIPYLPQRVLADNLSSIISSGPRLDFLPFEPWPDNRMSWKWEENKAKEEGKRLSGKSSSRFGELSVITAVLVLGYYYFSPSVFPLALTFQT